MEKYIRALHDLEHQRKSVQVQLECGILDAVDATNEVEIIMRKEMKVKEKLVLEVHVGKNGPRKIEYKEGKQLYQTVMPGKSKLTAKTYEGLIEKLFDYYGLRVSNSTVGGIWESAIQEKASGDMVNEDTISHLKSAYKRFMTDDITRMDIRDVTKAVLREFTQNMVIRLHPKKKAFLEYKSVLNLIWGYALEYDIIATNPVLGIQNSKYLKGCDCTKATSEEKILSVDDIERVKREVRRRMSHKTYNGYFINGYAVLLSIETGMRVAELCALRWDDIKTDTIHIHAQQLSHAHEGGKEYYYAGWTKDEKGVPRGGRYFPLTIAIRNLLEELKRLQEGRCISSEYVFCHEDGAWIKTDAYETCLRRLMKSMGFNVTNNHAFRMSLNSNVFVPLGIPVADRAKLLGHSVETNERYYTHARINVMDDICSILDAQVSPKSHPNVIPFEQRKSPESSKLKAFN